MGSYKVYITKGDGVNMKIKTKECKTIKSSIWNIVLALILCKGDLEIELRNMLNNKLLIFGRITSSMKWYNWFTPMFMKTKIIVAGKENISHKYARLPILEIFKLLTSGNDLVDVEMNSKHDESRLSGRILFPNA